ncbi:MAG: hypothetical protein A2860_01030 [Candidatus Levybacteria bacterium RIFCSPHIGHO2_01_FULL_37_33]|nr:MAG: hypothetical protein A2860_01030 [Candidatus Levybacteria bacterium RIFCSPHIGHO2_01_FULL_37_33]OGH29097.1 MAG: hypothetical protein A3F30_00905 [Candidatus Levybacteria bacterium RIFCSPHIGHO2_12_FULL_37_12]OGH32520.1 MAG: hypothetical protein A2953_02585 [Candidatus Levybacteria bacterium RIFCSPLOWO2_01_FULL_36_54]
MSYFALLAAAATCNPNTEVSTDLGCIPNDPFGFVSKFYAVGLGLIGGVALLFIIYGGYIILTSQGQSDQLGRGKSYIYYAIAGLLLAIFGFVFIQVIAVDILHIPGFK